MTRRIGFIGYDQVTALDLVGPLEAFAAANQCLGRRAFARRFGAGPMAYRKSVITLEGSNEPSHD